MEFTAEQIASLLNGTVEGDQNVSVSNLSKIEEGASGTLSFLANPAWDTDGIDDIGLGHIILLCVQNQAPGWPLQAPDQSPR